MVLATIAGSTCCQQVNQRAQSFAAAADDVMTDLIDQDDSEKSVRSVIKSRIGGDA